MYLGCIHIDVNGTMTDAIQLADGTEIEQGDHLVVTCEDAQVDQFEGDTEMQAQRLEDNGSNRRIYFHDADGNEALYASITGLDDQERNLRVTGSATKVARIVNIEVV